MAATSNIMHTAKGKLLPKWLKKKFPGAIAIRYYVDGTRTVEVVLEKEDHRKKPVEVVIEK